MIIAITYVQNKVRCIFLNKKNVKKRNEIKWHNAMWAIAAANYLNLVSLLDTVHMLNICQVFAIINMRRVICIQE